MRAIVIGGAGFLGSHIIDRLKDEKIEVLCIDRSECDTAYLQKINVPIVYGDITDKDALKRHIKKGDLVFHVAAILGAANASWKTYDEINVKGTRNALDAAIEQGAASFSFMSTYGVYGPYQGSLETPLTESMRPDPYSYYDKSKFLGEKYIEEHASQEKICCIIFRAPPIFGPRANPRSGTGILLNMLRKGMFVTIGDTRQKFSICYVKNLANAFVYFAKKNTEGIHIYNMASHPVESFENFLSEVRKYYVFRVLKVPTSIGLFLANIAAFVSKATQTKPLIPKDLVLGLVSDAYNSNIEKAINDGYKQEYSLAHAVRETVESLEKKI